jgi:hypothetical protein
MTNQQKHPVDMTLPELVREFTAIKCAAARGERTTRDRHLRLGLVVDQLRARGALD